MENELPKGYKMEELLRIYFLQSGYYAARGIPFKYRNFDITDIDLWLYNRTSSVSRDISIIDVKNKKTPKAIERIFWVKGLQMAIKADNALVATTDKKHDVKDFGNEMDVFVLDGNFLNKIKKFEREFEHRITDEEFFQLINEYALAKLDGDWKKVYEDSKSLLALGLNFDNLNQLINNASFFAEKVIKTPSQKEIALRCFYQICSFISINIDYIQKELLFLEDASLREKAFSNGFKYGSRGEKEIKKIIDMSLDFIAQYSDNGSATANQARVNIYKDFNNTDTNHLAQYFSKFDVLKNTFNTAIEFEKISMSKTFTNHLTASTEVKSFIGVLLDYYSIDRVKFLNATK